MENSFGEFLKQKRQEKKLTQKELAKILIVSESAVSKWEKDVAHPDITLLPKISEALPCAINIAPFGFERLSKPSISEKSS